MEGNLPGTGDTVIKQAVPPGGDLALHLAKLKLAISPNVGNSGAQFLVVGDCVRASPFVKLNDYVRCPRHSLWISLEAGERLSHCFYMHLTLMSTRFLPCTYCKPGQVVGY